MLDFLKKVTAPEQKGGFGIADPRLGPDKDETLDYILNNTRANQHTEIPNLKHQMDRLQFALKNVEHHEGNNSEENAEQARNIVSSIVQEIDKTLD